MTPSASKRNNDPRGEASRSDLIDAVKLALEASALASNTGRILKLIAWIVEQEEIEREGTTATRVFIAGIRETS